MVTTVRHVASRLTGTPWSVRLTSAPHGWSALEIYEDEHLIDVVVATPAAPGLLRDARRGVRAGHPCAVAWGRSPTDPNGLEASFTWGRPRTDALHADVLVYGDFIWLAVADGPFNGVTVSQGGATVARRRIRRALPGSTTPAQGHVFAGQCEEQPLGW
jgi:hypothetical protein